MSNVAAMWLAVVVAAVIAAAVGAGTAAQAADRCLALASPSSWPVPLPSLVANVSATWAPASEAEAGTLSVGTRCDLVQQLVGPDPAAWAAPFDPDTPAVLTNVTDNRAFAALCHKDNLLAHVRRRSVTAMPVCRPKALVARGGEGGGGGGGGGASMETVSWFSRRPTPFRACSMAPASSLALAAPHGRPWGQVCQGAQDPA
jgi:hypothetical protein